MKKSHRRHKFRSLSTAVVLGLLLMVACGNKEQPAQSSEMQKVTFFLDYLPGAVHVGFYAAEANGYYKDANLDVEIIPGRGSLVASQQVATGAAMVGFADFSAVANGVASGQKVKMVAAMLQQGAHGLSYLCSSGIKTPADLKGKRVATTAGAATDLLFTALLAKNGLKDTDVPRVVTDPAASTSTVLRGEADARTTVTYDQGLQIEAKKEGKEGCSMAFADHGIVAMGHGVISSSSVMASDPNIIRGFIVASSKGWQFAIDNPERAIAQMLKLAPDADEQQVRTGWPVIPPLLHTDATKGRPLGFMATDDIETTLNLLKETGVISERLAADQYFTNQFIR